MVKAVWRKSTNPILTYSNREWSHQRAKISRCPYVSLFPCLLALCFTLLLSGCFRRTTVPNMSFDLNELLPAGWTPVGTVREIDIDNDPAMERLVFFSYDKSPQTNLGPIGALIFPQVDTCYRARGVSVDLERLDTRVAEKRLRESVIGGQNAGRRSDAFCDLLALGNSERHSIDRLCADLAAAVPAFDYRLGADVLADPGTADLFADHLLARS